MEWWMVWKKFWLWKTVSAADSQWVTVSDSEWQWMSGCFWKALRSYDRSTYQSTRHSARNELTIWSNIGIQFIIHTSEIIDTILCWHYTNSNAPFTLFLYFRVNMCITQNRKYDNQSSRLQCGCVWQCGWVGGVGVRVGWLGLWLAVHERVRARWAAHFIPSCLDTAHCGELRLRATQTFEAQRHSRSVPIVVAVMAEAVLQSH